MLTGSEERVAPSGVEQTRCVRVLRLDWLGQTAASVFWMCSVFIYGINSMGDWLQLYAASAWLIANLATLVTDKAK